MLKRYDLILYEALLEKGMITREVLEPCAAESEKSGEIFARILNRRGLLSEKDALVILAEKLKLPLIDLRRTAIDKKVIDKIPAKVAIYYKFVPLGIKDRTFMIAVSYPLDIKVQDEIRTQLGYDIEAALSSSDDIEDALKKYYGAMAETLDGIASTTPKGQIVQAREAHEESVEDIEKMEGLGVFSGLMFKPKEMNALLFEFKKGRRAIHSLFCRPFIAVWLLEGKIQEYRIIDSWMWSIRPDSEFDKLIEIPINNRYQEIVSLFAEQ